MKYAFYLLLLCTVVFYLWETGAGREKSDVDRYEITLPADSERIALIKELPEIPKKAPEATPKVEEVPAAAVEQPKQETAEPPPAKDSEAAGAQSQPEAAAVPPQDGCFLLGPYRSASVARNALDGLKSRVEQGQVVARYDDVEDGYWVLYPKAENLDVGRANRKMLMEKGIQDLWLFDKGELQGAISLGIYKTKERAESLQSKLREQGVEAEVTPRLIRAKAPWLQFHWKGERAELDALVGSLASEHPERQENRLKPCD
jgi:hypothetical protein